MKPTVKDIAILANSGYSRENTAERSTIRLVIFKRHGKVITDTPFFHPLLKE